MRVYNLTGYFLLPRNFYALLISCSMESQHVISLPLVVFMFLQTQARVSSPHCSLR